MFHPEILFFGSLFLLAPMIAGQALTAKTKCTNMRFVRVQQVSMTPLRHIQIGNAAECGKLCMETLDCTAFSFAEHTHSCSLLKENALCASGNVFKGFVYQTPGTPTAPTLESSPNDISIRLVPGPQQGRLEIKYQSTWGTVCDDKFTNVNARVVCRELGLPAANAVYRGSGYYGGGLDPILLDDISCNGSEAFLHQCTHKGWGCHNCAHTEDVGVVCE